MSLSLGQSPFLTTIGLKKISLSMAEWRKGKGFSTLYGCCIISSPKLWQLAEVWSAFECHEGNQKCNRRNCQCIVNFGNAFHGRLFFRANLDFSIRQPYILCRIIAAMVCTAQSSRTPVHANHRGNDNILSRMEGRVLDDEEDRKANTALMLKHNKYPFGPVYIFTYCCGNPLKEL